MIVYEDDDIIVCHKPAGVPVQSASVRTKDMVSILRTHLQENSGQDHPRSDKDVEVKAEKPQRSGSKNTGVKRAGEEPRDVYVVHRLDQPVEGVMVFAKTKRAAAELSRQAAGDGMKKRYYAVVELTEAAELNQWHTLVDYLVKDGCNNRSFVSGAGKKDAKRAELRYRILKLSENGQSSQSTRALDGQSALMQAAKGLALAEIELKTGRHHQIRVQMAHAGMPLYGDRKYNPGKAKLSEIAEAKNAGRDLNTEFGSQPLALCAVSLTFRHPRTQKEMTFSVKPEAAIFREMA